MPIKRVYRPKGERGFFPPKPGVAAPVSDYLSRGADSRGKLNHGLIAT